MPDLHCGCDVSTGFLRQERLCPPDDNVVVASPGKKILFSPDTPPNTKYSPSFTVSPGQAILIDAYNMPRKQPIWVNRIVKSSQRPATGHACNPCDMHSVYEGMGLVTFRDRMRLGRGASAWMLYKGINDLDTRTQLLIAVPGTYELELSDVNMLGDLEVEYMAWDNSLTAYLPKDYFAGTIRIEGDF